MANIKYNDLDWFLTFDTLFINEPVIITGSGTNLIEIKSLNLAYPNSASIIILDGYKNGKKAIILELTNCVISRRVRNGDAEYLIYYEEYDCSTLSNNTISSGTIWKI